MSYSATEDSNPIVRKNALQFWKNVIQSQLTMQGMIDGAFPEVTFSKQSRKIVVLNDIEVRKRLVKVLQQLSEIGCLSAMKMVLEDSDSDVLEAAKIIVNDFYDLLKKYEVTILDVESVKASKTKDTNFEMDDILENEINFKGKGRNIFQPELFLDYIKDYFKPVPIPVETSQVSLIETILKEILASEDSNQG